MTRGAFALWIDRAGPRVLLLWAGLALGVAFLATPAKFLAPTLSLPVALDVGRQTFAIFNRTELVLLAGLAALGGWSLRRMDWYLSLSVPGAVVIIEALWLLPALDARVSTILGGQTPAPSGMHAFYIGAEALKAIWLLWAGIPPSISSRRRKPAGQCVKPRSDPMYEFIMRPSNAVCDAFGLEDEHERGMMRMLVNMILTTGIVAIAFSVAWRFVAP